MNKRSVCPCGKGAASQCCLPLLQGQTYAHNAEQLMRSRYTAFVMRSADYLLATWHPSTRPSSLDLYSAHTKWLGLEIKEFNDINDHQADVTFVARFKEGGGPAVRLHERSRFEKIEGRWFYVDGTFL